MVLCCGVLLLLFISALEINLVMAEENGAKIDWEWINPYPSGNTVTGAWADTRDNLFVVGEAGNSFVREKSGEVTTLKADNDFWFSSVWGSSEGVFAAGYRGLVARFNEDTATWESMETGNTNDLNSIWGSSAENIYAVGDRGTIIRYDGTRWQQIKTGSDDLLFGIWGSSASDIIAVGGRGKVLRFDGTSWNIITGLKKVHFVGVWGNRRDNVYIYGDRGTVIHFNGEQWKDISLSLENSAHNVILIRGVITDENATLYAVSDNGVIFIMRNNAWSQFARIADLGMARILGVAQVAKGAVLFGDGGRIYSFKDGKVLALALGEGKNSIHRELHKVIETGDGNYLVPADGVVVNIKQGQVLENGRTATLWDAWKNRSKWPFGRKARGIYLAASGGLLMKYDPETDKKEIIDTGVTNDLFGLWGDGRKIFGVGSGGLVFEYDGNKFKIISDGKSKKTLFSIWGRRASDIYAVGEEGTILHYDGNVWTKEESGTDVPLFAVSGIGSNIFVVGDNGTVLKKTAGIWKMIRPSTFAPLYDIWVAGKDNVYFAGGRGTLLNYSVTKNTLSLVSLPTFNDLYGISGSYADGEIILVGEDGTVIKGSVF